MENNQSDINESQKLSFEKQQKVMKYAFKSFIFLILAYLPILWFIVDLQLLCRGETPWCGFYPALVMIFFSPLMLLLGIIYSILSLKGKRKYGITLSKLDKANVIFFIFIIISVVFISTQGY